MHRNQRQLVVALLVLLVVAIVLAAGFVGCGLQRPSDHDDPTVHGPHTPVELVTGAPAG